MKLKPMLTAVYFTLNIYVFSVGTLQGLLNYSPWKLIGPTEFPAFHQAVDQRILWFFLPFSILSVPFNFVMIWARHPQINKHLTIVVAFVNLFIFVITVALAIPIQDQLAQAKSVVLIDKLVNLHVYFRTLPGLINFVAITTMCYQLITKVPVLPTKNT